MAILLSPQASELIGHFEQIGETLIDLARQQNIAPEQQDSLTTTANTIVQQSKALYALPQISAPDGLLDAIRGLTGIFPAVVNVPDASSNLQNIAGTVLNLLQSLINGSEKDTTEQLLNLSSLLIPYGVNVLFDFLGANGSNASQVSPEIANAVSGSFSGMSVKQVADSLDNQTHAQQTGTTKTPVESRGVGYWLIRLDYATWDKKFKQGIDEILFTTYLDKEKGVKRPGYELFKRLKKGDLVLGNGYGDIEGIICLLEVKEGIHPDDQHGETVTLSVTKVLDPVILQDSFEDKINFIPDFESTPEKKLYRLEHDEYFDIIQTVPRPGRAVISPMSSDALQGSKAQDALDFTSDVSALAAIISYNKVEPPLAVGLFGNWGSGKSFFMTMLQEEIDRLRKTESPVYCREIVTVHFNSWHYSDANLWASLITKIFAELDRYGEEIEDDQKAQKLNVLFTSLNSAQEQIAENKKKLDAANAEISRLQTERNKLDEEITNKSSTLTGLSMKDIAEEIFSADELKEPLQKLKDIDILDVSDKEKLDEAKKTINETGSTFRQVLKLISELPSKKIWYPVLITLLVVCIIYGVIALVSHSADWIGSLKSIVPGIVAPILAPLAYYGPAFSKRLKKFRDELQRFSKTYDRLKTRVADKYEVERNVLKTTITNAIDAKDKIEKEVSLLEIKQTSLQTELDETASGKKLSRFIEGRVSDQRYAGSLGIISWIRKDFEELNFLLKQQYELEKLKKLGTDIKKTFEIDRIILYVDDLDRCEIAVVDNVLKAINLLLAFPLFVVVVGVDPRWMHNALNEKYGVLLGGGNKLNNGTVVSGDDDVATSYDYLEKIFQVPFVLRTMDKTGRSQLIRNQLKTGKAAEAAAAKNSTTGTQNQANASGFNSTDTNKKTDTAGASTRAENIGSADDKQTQPRALNNDTPPQVPEKLLEVSAEETSFMEAISFLIGDSPRKIKRYINVYRVIRVHPRFRSVGKTDGEDYLSVMVLLAVLTGLPDIASYFFAEIEKFKDEKDKKTQTLFRPFLKSYLEKSKGTELTQLMAEMSKDNDLKKLANISMYALGGNLKLVKRFSFRDL